MGKIREKNDKIRHIMTQMASLLAVATSFIGLWTVVHVSIREVAYTQDKTTYIYMYNMCVAIQAKSAGGGAYARGRRAM
jgi:hypothetical protein